MAPRAAAETRIVSYTEQDWQNGPGRVGICSDPTNSSEVTGLSDNDVREDPEARQTGRGPGNQAIPQDYVLLCDPPDYETAEIILATLASAGVHAVMENPSLGPADNFLPPLGASWSHAIHVAREDIETARAIVDASPPTDEELAAEQAADPTTLDEAERNVRNA